MSPPADSSTLREEGNALYKAGKVIHAIKKYKEARRLAPNESAPLRNLSAAFYEIGGYTQSESAAKLALEKLKIENGEDLEAQTKKLNQRIEKAKLYEYQVDEGKQRLRRRRIIQSIPRSRASMFSSTEYYCVGHDTISSLFDYTIDQANPDGQNVSFFMAGIGDARNLLRSIIAIAKHERNSETSKNYHFTINDINKHAMARDLVVLVLLQHLSDVGTDTEEGLQTLNTLFFVYASTMMPRCALDQLHQTITKVLQCLKAGTQPLAWLYLHKEDLPSYIKALESWQGDGLNLFTNAQVIQKVTFAMVAHAMQMQVMLEQLLGPLPSQLLDPNEDMSPALQTEKELYHQAALLLPPRKILEAHDPEMLALVDQYAFEPKRHAKKFKDHLIKNWNVNTTLIDLEWYPNTIFDDSYDVGHDPFELIDHFGDEGLPTQPQNPTRLYDHVAPVFIDASNAITQLQSRLQVEAVLGDYIDFAERLQFKLYDDEDSEQEGTLFRPKDFPHLFDRVHLSNIPDYTAGHLSTFLHAMPIIKKDRFSSYLTANCLRNSDSWSSVNDYLAEYQLITDDTMLQQLTRVIILEKGSGILPLANYTLYSPGPEGKTVFYNLLPRKAFTKWFYALFFKLALPVFCNIRNKMKVIAAPLTLTIIFRLLSNLRTIGYPSHWLAEALTNIIENKVSTTGRPPRTLPVKIVDVKYDHPIKKLSTAPFAQEMATLAQLFQPLLPFKLTSSIIPPLDTIYNYTFHLPEYYPFLPRSTCLMLVLFDQMQLMRLPYSEDFKSDLRHILDPSWGDEVDSRYSSPAIESFREKGVKVWTAFKWDIESKTASAWMPRAFVERLAREEWWWGLYRSDLWKPVFNLPARVKHAKRGECWTDRLG